MRYSNISALILIVVLLLASCHTYEDRTIARSKKAKTATGDIKIAVMWATSVYKDSFVDGIKLATEEVNQRGGVLGRKIKLVAYDDKREFSRAMSYARDIAGDPDTVAVIGHQSSLNAISASVIYNFNGLLFISPSATSPVLTGHGFSMVFRITPSDHDIAKNMANFAYKTGFRKIAVVDDQSIYGKQLANIFVEHANELGIEVVTRRLYFPWQHTVKPLLAEMREQPIDAIFLAGDQPGVSSFIKEARIMNIKVPFIGGSSLDSSILLGVAGVEAAEGTIVPSVYNPHKQDANTLRFRDSFKLRYGIEPDTTAVQGYDAMNLLAFAFQETKSTVPLVVSTYLRFVKDWPAITSPVTFDMKGDLVNKKVYFKVMRSGKFEFLPELNDSVTE